MVHRLPSLGAYERLEPYAGKLARTVLRGEWRSNALFLPDRPAGANGNGTEAPPPAETPAAGQPDPLDEVPF